MLKSYKELRVWQLSIKLVKEVYTVTKKMPSYERYVLVDQMRRAVISIPSNIAEGYGRNSRKEYLRYIRIANASSFELETQLIVSKELYPNIKYSEVDSLISSVQKMLYCLNKSLLTPDPKP